MQRHSFIKARLLISASLVQPVSAWAKKNYKREGKERYKMAHSMVRVITNQQQ
jgi:hypothetical protein